jgi:hypothetical protein
MTVEAIPCSMKAAKFDSITQAEHIANSLKAKCVLLHWPTAKPALIFQPETNAVSGDALTRRGCVQVFATTSIGGSQPLLQQLCLNSNGCKQDSCTTGSTKVSAKPESANAAS